MFGIDRQVYYRKIKRRFNKQNQARLVVDMVLEIRQQMPRIGARKLYYLLGNNLTRASSSIIFCSGDFSIFDGV